MGRFLPSFVRDLRLHRPSWGDLQASIAVTFMAVPQGVAYAMIAGLPPAMGLYAAALPATVGSLFRSSRHVVAGPTNALSLLVGTAIIATGGDPVTIALQLAVMVGLVQAAAGLLRLGLLVDYVSGAVVLGYITGAAVLILVGQLPNLTGSPGGSGFLVGQMVGWVTGIGGIGWASVALGLGAMGIVWIQRRFFPRAPGAVAALGAALLVSWSFDLHAHGGAAHRGPRADPGVIAAVRAAEPRGDGAAAVRRVRDHGAVVRREQLGRSVDRGQDGRPARHEHRAVRAGARQRDGGAHRRVPSERQPVTIGVQ